MNRPAALIIEDDPQLGKIYKTALEQAGFQTDLDSTGKSFPDSISASIPTLILLDIHLPFASGKEILSQLRSDVRLADTTFIIATADLFLAKSVEKLADFVLIKPVSVARLMKIVADKWPDRVNAQDSQRKE
jgi:DNA-binding response OmpR family regulator